MNVEKEYTKGTYERFTYKKYSDHIEISRYDLYAGGEVIIPAEIEELPVTSIGYYAFAWCKSLAEITIPGSVIRIGDNAFKNCSSLTDITIPDGVTSIGRSAFEDCSSLTKITIPESVTSIGEGSFWGCSSLTEITIPESVTYICEGAFAGCSSLTEITIPESVTSIDHGAFSYCSSLEKIVIENPECEIDDSAYTIADGRNDDYEPYFNGTIYGYHNSTAQAYAEKYNRKFVSLGEAPETAGGNALIGDANCDGTVDLADATAIIQHIGNEAKYALSEQGLANADCNSDGKITGADALAIQKLEAKIISQLPDVSE